MPPAWACPPGRLLRGSKRAGGRKREGGRAYLQHGAVPPALAQEVEEGGSVGDAKLFGKGISLRE